MMQSKLEQLALGAVSATPTHHWVMQVDAVLRALVVLAVLLLLRNPAAPHVPVAAEGTPSAVCSDDTSS